MRSGNTMDGMYFFLLITPFIIGIWAGGLLKKNIINHLLLAQCRSQNLSVLAGVSTQILVMLIGLLSGLFLTMVI